MSKVLLHIPHSSRNVPSQLRRDILLSDTELAIELEVLTDLYTNLIFQGEDRIVANFSRFVCDVERFENDELESMSKLGMGAVYIKTPFGKDLRHIDAVNREHIMNTYYRPHHVKFDKMVTDKLNKYNECFIVDCHSFSDAITYVDMSSVPQVCVGVDLFHTPAGITNRVVKIFEEKGYTAAINNPFDGSIVPLRYYNTDLRVKSMMLEINKNLYVKDGTEIDEEGINKITSACNEVIELLSI